MATWWKIHLVQCVSLMESNITRESAWKDCRETEAVAHHGTELVALLAEEVGRTYTCSSPSDLHPPWNTQAG